MKKRIYISLIILVLIVFVWENFPMRRTSVFRYSGALEKWGERGLVGHFPKSVPDNATNVVYSSHDGFMQGGSHLQVKFQVPEEEIREIYDEATAKAKQYHDGGNSVTLVNSRKDGLRSTSPHILADSYYFPDDYRVFVYDAETSSHWNHGNSCGVVISLERSEVIYYAESW